jgi:endonuclease YncB( thermonuclease family)
VIAHIRNITIRRPTARTRHAVWLALLFTTLATVASAQTVTRVVDGDTIIVSGVGSVRLIGVDTPETVDPRKPVQYFSAEASAFTRSLALGQAVRLEYDHQRTDNYGRTLAYVYLPDGSMLNAETIKRGYGHAYTVFPFRHLEQFRVYERTARDARLGLWAIEPFMAAAVPATEAHDTVYVTRTGTKYHRAGCRHLARSQIPMALADAVKQFRPCSVCRPPVLGNTPSAIPATTPDVVRAPRVPAPRVAAPTPAPQPTPTSGQCQAITKKGSQCSRRAQAGSAYCWQHAR